MKYDLKGHGRSHKVLLAKFFLAHSFINSFLKKYIERLKSEIPSFLKGMALSPPP